MNTAQPLVYVTTPVYNGEAFLHECIESVLAQIYSNWVYTIVNNCSTDRTLQIAEQYAERDCRIRIHNNENFLRVIDNHNLAYSLMPPESKYCKPLMADDWLYPECLSKMVRIAEQEPSIGLVCACAFDGKHMEGEGLPSPGTLAHGRDICRAALLEGRHVFGSPTWQLFRADLIRKRQPFYASSNLHSDVDACLDILQESDFGFVDDVLTFNRTHEGSITSQVKTLESIFVGKLAATVKFGPVYLNDTELNERLKSQFDQYYQILAKHFLRVRGPQFWNFHRTKLRELGYSIDKRRLLKAVWYELFWLYRLYWAKRTISAIVPPGDSFILVDQEEWGEDDFIAGRRRFRFLERNGQYWGMPEDDAAAIRELKRLRLEGARYIVFAWPAFWWLGHYSELRRHLDAKFPCVAETDHVIAYNLSGG